ncbi:MAG: putative Ig domain-containing protein, partial [Verrucomicrobia bacterium]|nr:putative Ig domain-containing protein [Verrucomicrobiota bacterium]
LTILASNAAGSRPSALTLHVKDYTRWEYSAPITIPGYDANDTLTDFPVYIEIDDNINSFSYEQFSSSAGFDLRFVGPDGAEELKYEPVKWNPTGVSAYWVRVPELKAGTTITAKWGNPNATTQPDYCLDGSIWNRYHAVWHMEGDDPTVIRESSGSLHGTAINFKEIPRVPGVIGKALSFDGINDYVNLPLESHPPGDAKQLTISFWSYGGASLPKNTSILESGSSLGRHLNIHHPWSNGRIYWDAGSGSIDRIEKDDFEYRGKWVHWTFQKESSIGAMYIYKNGEEWMSGYSRTRPFGGPVDNFRLGSARTGGNYWNGWLDEVRISLDLASAASIKASYSSQIPGANFVSIGTVEGPPALIPDQVIRGFANDANRSVSYALQTFPSATQFAAAGLPFGLSINSSTGEITGNPIQGSSTNITVTASNLKGEDQGIVSLVIVDVNEFTHKTAMSFEGYDGNETLKDFPALIRLGSDIPNFSLRSFQSSSGNDLRFFDDKANELAYEIDEWNEASGELLVWVRLAELHSDLNVTAYWGHALHAGQAPTYAYDGSTWSSGYKGVWHLGEMNSAGVLTDSSITRNHADDHDGLDRPSSIIGTGRTIGEGSNTFISVPYSSSLKTLEESDYSFSTWIRLEDELPNDIPNAFLARGWDSWIPSNGNDTYFNDINQGLFSNKQFSGQRIWTNEDIHLDNDNEFMGANIGITSNDWYMSCFISTFVVPETGNYGFRMLRKDDRAVMWMDLDKNKKFDGNEKIGGNNNFTKDPVSPNELIAGEEYLVAFAHGEGGGGSRIEPWIKTPSVPWVKINPADPVQNGWYKVPLDGSVAEDLSSMNIYSYGSGKSFYFGSLAKPALHHTLESKPEPETITSTIQVQKRVWRHLSTVVDVTNGKAKIYLDGNLTGQTDFDPEPAATENPGLSWVFGQGMVESAYDEVRLAGVARSDAWIKASYHNQKPNQTFPAYGSVIGPNSINTPLNFTMEADQAFSHDVNATNPPLAFTATGLPGGLILDSSSGIISGTPSRSGEYEAMVTALFLSGQNPSEKHTFTIHSVLPQIAINSVTVTTSTAAHI